jgi:hypothetical protein
MVIHTHLEARVEIGERVHRILDFTVELRVTMHHCDRRRH